jgi:hypothetical protein
LPPRRGYFGIRNSQNTPPLKATRTLNEYQSCSFLFFSRVAPLFLVIFTTRVAPLFRGRGGCYSSL